MPANTVYVGRPTKWGNPYRVGDGLCKTASMAVRYYERFVEEGLNFVSEQTAPEIAEIRRELAGKNLACWCSLDEPCHADVLLRIANEAAEDGDE
jgi:hypothetical protein